MKKVISIFLSILCVVIIGCQEDSNTPQILKVVKSDTNIKATGGDAKIQIEATSNVTVTSDVDWCQVVEVKNGIIQLLVAENKDYPGRTAQVIITDGISTQQVTLIQEGAVLIYKKEELVQRSSNEKKILPITLSSSFPIQVIIPEKDKEWLSFELYANLKGGEFTVQKNATNAPRGSNVTIKSSDRMITYQIMQYDVSNFVGSWVGQYTSSGRINSLPKVEIAGPDANGTYTISGLFLTSAYDYKVKASYNNKMFSLVAGQKVGSYITTLPLDVYFSIIDNTGYPIWTADASIGLMPVLRSDNSMILSFSDNGGVPGGASGICFTGFYGEPSVPNFQGYIRILYNCSFSKLTP